MISSPIENKTTIAKTRSMMSSSYYDRERRGLLAARVPDPKITKIINANAIEHLLV
jgi:hypothetical protein